MNGITPLLALACAVLPSFAQKVHVDYDRGCNFSRYKTYRWVQLPESLQPAAAQSPEGPFPNQLMHERIMRFVEEALAAKRLTRVETGGDLLVGYEMKMTEEPQYTTVSDGWGWGWGSAFSTTTTQIILTGTLVIDMMDPRQKQLVFQGVSTETISSKPEKNTKKLQKGINKMFGKYPPRM